MGNNLRLLHQNLASEVAGTVTSEATGFRLVNLLDGNRHTFWRASTSSTGAQSLEWDAGVGQTKTADYFHIERADLLVAVSASIIIRFSTSGSTSSSWTNAFNPATPLSSTDLIGPTNTDYVREFAQGIKRNWSLLITCSTAAPSMANFRLGTLTEVPVNPRWGPTIGSDRTYRGANYRLEWGEMSHSQAKSLADTLATLTPAHPQDAPVETLAGVPYGGLPCALYDPIGIVFGSTARQLVPALCHTPDAAVMTVNTDTLAQGAAVDFRQRT